MPDNTMLDAALSYAKAGWAIFPLTPNSKIPLAGSRGWQDATPDPVTIKEWWTAHPGANIGFWPESAGMCVVDVDAGGEWIETHPYRVQTPHGEHFYYAGSLPQSASKIAPHVDTRGTTGYVLLPPSRVDGKPYLWDQQPTGAWDLPELDPWVAEACAAPKAEIVRDVPEFTFDTPAKLRRGESYLAACEKPVEGAGSDIACYQHFAMLSDFGLTNDTAMDMMAAWTGFDPDWLWEKLEHAEAYRENAPGAKTVEASFGEFAKNMAALGIEPGPDKPASFDQVQGISTSEARIPQSKYLGKSPADWWDRPEIAFLDEDKMFPDIPTGAVGLVYGESGAHKTNVLLTKLFDAAEAKGARVLYIAGEGVYGFCRDRTQAHAKGRHLNKAWVGEHIRVVEYVPSLSDVDAVVEMITVNQPFRPTIVVVDTLATATPGLDENTKAFSDVLADSGACGAIRRGFNGALVLVVTHQGKDEKRGARGHSGQLGNTDFDLHVVADKKANVISLTAIKMRDGAKEGYSAYYQVEETGVPVPVRITAAEFMGKVKPATASDPGDMVARVVPSIMRAVMAEGDELDNGELAKRWTIYEQGERPSEPYGEAEWDTARYKHQRQLQNASSSGKKWALAYGELRVRPGGTDRIPRWWWRLPKDELKEF